MKNFILICLLLSIFSDGNIYSQNINESELSDEQYKLINDYYSRENSNFHIYNRTYFEKDWAYLFNESNFEIFKNIRSLGTKISFNELEKIFDKEIKSKIDTKIYSAKPVKLSNSKISPRIELSKTFDRPKDIRENVRRISEPIIFGDVAVIKEVTLNEGRIFFLKKNEMGNWEMIYNAHQWLILH